MYGNLTLYGYYSLSYELCTKVPPVAFFLFILYILTRLMFEIVKKKLFILNKPESKKGCQLKVVKVLLTYLFDKLHVF